MILEKSALPQNASTQCCIAGGGPAGVMLGYILARAGVDVIILEKHKDFFRDFRGDTIHPSTFGVMRDLGLLDQFLQVPHDELRELSGRIGGEELKLVDFSLIPGPCKYIGFMPQWDFLNFLSDQGRKLSTFRIEMSTEATDLLYEGETIAGVRAQGPGGTSEIRAPLVVAADGRDSRLRERAGMHPRDYGVPIDVLWMRISRKANASAPAFGNVAPGGLLVTINRGDYFQCAFVIRKGGFDEIKQRGIEYLRQRLLELSPYLGESVNELQSFDDVKLLTVSVNRLPVWARPGFLCIGDAAHAMSPIGGVGINLAIQDAVATANILAQPLKSKSLRMSDLSAVQRRRGFPTQFIQGLQLFIQNRLMTPLLQSSQSFRAPFIMRLLDRVRILRTIPAYVVGIGPRPERVTCLRLIPPQASAPNELRQEPDR